MTQIIAIDSEFKGAVLCHRETAQLFDISVVDKLISS